jgi:hypothetical protein
MTWTSGRVEDVEVRRDGKDLEVIGFDQLPPALVNHPVMAMAEENRRFIEITRAASDQ